MKSINVTITTNNDDDDDLIDLIFAQKFVCLFIRLRSYWFCHCVHAIRNGHSIAHSTCSTDCDYFAVQTLWFEKINTRFARWSGMRSHKCALCIVLWCNHLDSIPAIRVVVSFFFVKRILFNRIPRRWHTHTRMYEHVQNCTCVKIAANWTGTNIISSERVIECGNELLEDAATEWIIFKFLQFSHMLNAQMTRCIIVARRSDFAQRWPSVGYRNRI